MYIHGRRSLADTTGNRATPYMRLGFIVLFYKLRYHLHGQLKIRFRFAAQLVDNFRIVRFSRLVQGLHEDLTLDIRLSFLRAVPALCQAIEQQRVVAAHYVDGMEPSLREEVTRVVLDDVASAGHHGLEVIEQLKQNVINIVYNKCRPEKTI